MKRTCHYFGSGLLKTLTSLQAPCLCFLDLVFWLVTMRTSTFNGK